jgi:hypothetical protein
MWQLFSSLRVTGVSIFEKSNAGVRMRDPQEHSLLFLCCAPRCEPRQTLTWLHVFQ